MKKLASLSAFFPAFNEEKNIAEQVQALRKVLPTLAQKYEIIIINDGSQDRTGELADALSQKYSEVKVVHHPYNLGYGAGLRSGFTVAQYDWIFFTDGDLQFNVQQLSDLVKHTPRSLVIIGYRKRRVEGGIRAFNARLYTLFVDMLFRLHVRDIDCAFKLMRADVIKSIHLESTGALISAEFLYKLKKQGVTFTQVPVDHHERKHGSPTGASVRVIMKAMWEFMRLYVKMKYQHLRGRKL